MSRERRWVIIAEDGRHGGTVGRHTDPSEGEIQKLEDGLREQGIGGWLVVIEGVYYSNDELSVMQVRALGEPTGDWDKALATFLENRSAAARMG